MEAVNLESIFHTYDCKGDERVWKLKEMRDHQGSSLKSDGEIENMREIGSLIVF